MADKAESTKIVRTPTKATGGITEEERAKMKVHAEMWIRRVLRTDPIDADKIAPAIRGLYEVAKLKRPRVVLAPSPLAMAFAFGAAAAEWYTREQAKEKKGKPPAKRTETRVDDPVARAFAQATTPRIGATVGLVEQVIVDPEKAYAQTCRDLAGDFGIQCAARWSNVYQGGNMWASYDCYLTACRDILGLRLPSHAAYAHWEQAAIEGGFRVMHPEFCIVSDFPEFIKLDNERRPHAETGPSHRWRDGWSLYHWHGVRVPSEWIENRPSLTAKVALQWQNIEQRRCACEILGWANILRELDAKTIQKDRDPMIGELVEVTLEGNRERFLRVMCGTGREFAIPVPPEMTTALQANAWTYAIEDVKKFAKPEVRT